VANRLTIAGRDLVVRTLDRLADRLGGGGSAPSAIQQIADNWKGLTPAEREEIAGQIASAVEVVIAAIPLVIGGTAAAVAGKRRQKSAPASKRSAKKKSPARKRRS
jgi:hypothetical protein